MASKQAIVTVLSVLDSAGMANRPKMLDTDAGYRQLVEVWEAVTIDVPDADLMTAATSFVRRPDAKFWPSVGELIAAAPARRMAALDDADDAWGDLMRAVRERGRYKTPGEGWDLDRDPDRCDAMTRGLQAVGGWQAACNLTDDEVPAARAAFRGAYRTHRQRGALAVEERSVRALLGSRGIDLDRIGTGALKALPGGKP